MPTMDELIDEAVDRLVAQPDWRPTYDELQHAVAPDLPGRTLLIGEVADRLGISVHTLRFYEQEGLVRVPRDDAGRRAFDDATIGRLWFVAAMRASGLSISELRHYLDLEEDDPAARRTERVDLLTTHREALLRRIAELRLALTITDHKIAYCAALDADASAGSRRRTA